MQRVLVRLTPGVEAVTHQAIATAHDESKFGLGADDALAAIDGGMSDNPRPQLYGARYEALLAERADELATGVYRVAGKHCESGDVLIDAAELPRPERGDLLAVPATGAYTLSLSSNYHGVPRPAVVLVGGGAATVIRRREAVEDLLRYEG